MLKIAVLALWAPIVANFFFTFPEGVATSLKFLGVAFLAAHIAEYFLFSKEIKAKGDSTAKSMLMTLVFGIVYVKTS